MRRRHRNSNAVVLIINKVPDGQTDRQTDTQTRSRITSPMAPVGAKNKRYKKLNKITVLAWSDWCQECYISWTSHRPLLADDLISTNQPWLREAFIKKSVTIGGWGGRLSRWQNVTIFKVVLKNFGWKWGGVPILSQFPAIFGFWKFLQVSDTSRGQKTLFSRSAPIMV